jgi:Ser/Thr protein kinase RdoA (MazF antagonist)
MKALGNPIAIGRTAQVYAWGEGQVLKLYREWCPPHWADFEARVGRVVQEAGLPVPAVGDIVEVNGRRGLVYERLAGDSLLRTLLARPWLIGQFGVTMAEMHAALHRQSAPSDLPSQRSDIAGAIRHAQTLPEELKHKALAVLDRLPDGDRLCHGDFHPDNILMTARGPIIIDWMTARRGEPAGDFARTVLLMTVGEPQVNLFLRLLTRLLRGWMRSAYMTRYLQLVPEARERLDDWLTVIYAARMNENIPGEAEQLMAFVRCHT